MTFTPSLKNRLAPNTVAVIGASQRPQSLGAKVLKISSQLTLSTNLSPAIPV